MNLGENDSRPAETAYSGARVEGRQPVRELGGSSKSLDARDVKNLYLLFALLTGAGVAVQSVINARLRVLLDGPFWAAAGQFIVGLVFLLVVALLTRQPAPVTSGIARAPLWIWAGGLFGATVILVNIILTPKLGATLTLAMMIVGQLVAALVVDHYGLFGGTVVRLSILRVLGVALLLLGVSLIRWK